MIKKACETNLLYTENKITRKNSSKKCICDIFFRRPFGSMSLLGVCGKTQVQSHA